MVYSESKLKKMKKHELVNLVLMLQNNQNTEDNLGLKLFEMYKGQKICIKTEGDFFTAKSGKRETWKMISPNTIQVTVCEITPSGYIKANSEKVFEIPLDHNKLKLLDTYGLTRTGITKIKKLLKSFGGFHEN